MLRTTVNGLLARIGKDYIVPPDIPNGLLIHELTSRAVMLGRGLLLLRSNVFLGRQVNLLGRSQLHVGPWCTIEDGVRVQTYSREGVSIGARTKIGRGTVISCTTQLARLGVGMTFGADGGVGEYCYFGAAGGIAIGDEVVMGQMVSFHSENHVFSDRTKSIRKQGVVSTGIRIGSDVWIGAKATFLDGARIGSHSVVAAGAVVRGEFPPGSLIAGVPARLVRPIWSPSA